MSFKFTFTFELPITAENGSFLEILKFSLDPTNDSGIIRNTGYFIPLIDIRSGFCGMSPFIFIIV